MGIKSKQHYRRTTMRRELFKYISVLGISCIAMIILYLIFTWAAMRVGFILPANYNEQYINQIAPKVKSAKTVTENIIPPGSVYIVLDKQNMNQFYGNMEEKDIEVAKKVIDGLVPTYYGQKVYTVIERTQDYCVIQSYLRPQFNSPVLKKYLPDFEWSSIVILIGMILIAAFIITTIFAKQFSQNLSVLSKMTKSIKNQDLDFEQKHSNIQEFDDVMVSLIEMRDALKKSLEAQWKLEHTKKEQIAALAHDIKIPVTIIKGNAELLSLSEQSEEQSLYTRYILSAGNKIEQHIRLLIMMSKTEEALVVQKDTVSLFGFVNNLIEDTRAYSKCKSVEIMHHTNQQSDVDIYVDQPLLHRALMNILTNAVDYTPEHSQIMLHTVYQNQRVFFTITDQGEGFSPEALEKGVQLFYRGDKSRNSDGHYGMGLTFAEYVIKLHNGTLLLQNDTVTGSGQVKIELNVSATI